jgi:hypothetical protein
LGIVDTFDLSILKSFGPSQDNLSLEMMDLWGERYRKLYKSIDDCFYDCEKIAKRFFEGKLLPISMELAKNLDYKHVKLS